jgi:NADH-quinone oxidoreductase subunit G
MIKLTIDNIEVEVEPGTTILNAARKIGGAIVPPTMCYYAKLNGTGGKCRVCLVKVVKGSNADPRPMPKLVASCSTMAQDGMEVQNITSPEVIEARKGIVEFLLLNHPLDCPVCDQAGECDLQNLAMNYGSAVTRTREERNTHQPEEISPFISLNKNRCILCYRCLRVADQLTNERSHGVIFRGDHAEISTYLNTNAIDNDFSGNMIDVCPVGALTDKTFRFASRVWFTKPFDAHRSCSKCSGEVVLWMKGNEILRVTSPKDKNGEVEHFICNECRFEKKEVADWIIDGARDIDRESVISVNHYVEKK